MRICLVYDRLYPHAIGGAERWMRDLSVRLAEAGHDVTYVTTRRWSDDNRPQLPGVQIVGLTTAAADYGKRRRAVVPPLRFGLAVFRYLAREGASYDVVHTASFPYFPLLAAGVWRRRCDFRIVVDWHEVWTRAYWRSYAGAAVGTVGWIVQRLGMRVRHRALCMSRMHAQRLRAQGFKGRVTVLPGLYAGPTATSPTKPDDVVVYAGRHVPEKRVSQLVSAFATPEMRRSALRLELYGDGPERYRVERLIRELGLSDSVHVKGIRTEDEVATAIAHAVCMATASEREGYGLVVVEAAARGTPSVVVGGPENAAVELIVEGVNGAIAPSAAPEDLAAAIARVVDAGMPLRTSTRNWFALNASHLRIERSVAEVIASYSSDD
jgi:glycosyltransferase involved in cell wall biosynthesis